MEEVSRKIRLLALGFSALCAEVLAGTKHLVTPAHLDKQVDCALPSIVFDKEPDRLFVNDADDQKQTEECARVTGRRNTTLSYTAALSDTPDVVLSLFNLWYKSHSEAMAEKDIYYVMAPELIYEDVADVDAPHRLRVVWVSFSGNYAK